MSNHGKLQEYLWFRKTLKAALSIVGLWPSEKPQLWYRLIPPIQVAIGLVTIIGILNSVIHNITNLKIVIRILSVLTSTVLYTFKV